MQTYSISFSYSRDGNNWNRSSTSVKATSDIGAIAQVESKYPYVRDIRIMAVR